MELKDIVVGQKVKVCSYPHYFYNKHADKIATVDYVEEGEYDGILTVKLIFDEWNADGEQTEDWGNHLELLPVLEESSELQASNGAWEIKDDSVYISTANIGDCHILSGPNYPPLEFIPAGNEVLTRDTIRDKLDQIESLVDQIRNQMGL